MSGRKCSVEVFARVTGFFRPVQSWNKGKVEEFKDRKKYSLNMNAAENGTQNDNSRVAKPVAG